VLASGEAQKNTNLNRREAEGAEKRRELLATRKGKRQTAAVKSTMAGQERWGEKDEKFNRRERRGSQTNESSQVQPHPGIWQPTLLIRPSWQSSAFRRFVGTRCSPASAHDESTVH